MSNSGVNTTFAKCFIFFMAAVVLLQGSVYLGLSIWGILLRQCSQQPLDLSNEPFKFAMNLIYFLDIDCGSPLVILPHITEPITLDVNFNKIEPLAKRTYIIFISYAVISTLWIISSLAVITTLCGKITRTINGLCFWPWFLVVLAGSVLDVAATGFHIHDIMNTTSALKTFEYLGISANSNTIGVLTNFDAYFVTPAVVMTCISSRVLLIWLLNIFGTSFCLSLSNTLSKRNSSMRENCTTSISNNHQELPVEIQRCEEQSRANKRAKPTLPSLRIQSLKDQSVNSPQSPTAPLTNVYPKDLSSNLQKEILDDRTSETQLGGVSLPPGNASQYQQQLSPVSPLNNRYSINNENIQFPTQNQKVSVELRGQLPWSYTSVPPPVPKKPQMQIYPEIPAPDYGF